MGEPRAGVELPHRRRSATSESFTLRARSREASDDAFLDARALELCDGTEDASHEPAGRCGRVNALAHRDERAPARLPFVDQQDQAPQIAAKPIEPPAHYGLYLTSSGVAEELVERRPAILRAANAVVNVLDCGPAARIDVPPQLEQLILGGLILRADTRVDGTSHVTVVT